MKIAGYLFVSILLVLWCSSCSEENEIILGSGDIECQNDTIIFKVINGSIKVSCFSNANRLYKVIYKQDSVTIVSSNSNVGENIEERVSWIFFRRNGNIQRYDSIQKFDSDQNLLELSLWETSYSFDSMDKIVVDGCQIIGSQKVNCRSEIINFNGKGNVVSHELILNDIYPTGQLYHYDHGITTNPFIQKNFLMDVASKDYSLNLPTRKYWTSHKENEYHETRYRYEYNNNGTILKEVQQTFINSDLSHCKAIHYIYK